MKKIIGAASVIGILLYAAASVIRGIVFLTSVPDQAAANVLFLGAISILAAAGIVISIISTIFWLRGADIRIYASFALAAILAGWLIILLLPPQSYAIAEYRMHQYLGVFSSLAIHLVASLLLAGALLTQILYFVQVRRKAGALQPRP